MDSFGGHTVYVPIGEKAATRAHRNRFLRGGAVAASLIALGAVIALVSSSSGPQAPQSLAQAGATSKPAQQQLQGLDKLLLHVVQFSQILADAGNSTATDSDLYKQAVAEQDSLPGTGSSNSSAAPADPLYDQAVAEQDDLPKANGKSLDDMTDDEKALIEEAKKLGESDYISVDGAAANLTMPEEIQAWIDKMESALKEGTMKNPLDLVNISGKVDPIPEEIIASAKQAEDEMKIDDQTST